MTSTVTDVNELFDLLESSRPSTVAEIKNLIAEHFNTVRETWLVGGLFDYYLQTNSSRTLEILCGISKEPHDKYLIERISDGIRNPVSRKQSLTFLSYLVRKQPSWLFKIFNYGLFSLIIKILKTETDVVVLVTGLLTVVTLLPILPRYLAAYVNDIFEVFSRLAMWTHANNQEVAAEQLLHLQVGLYSLFHRLYAMYPCNFLSYLRHNFSSQDKGLVFHHTLKPMLETVKMHPFLVTASRDTELASDRWKSKEYHDVIAECSKLSIDVHESGVCEETSFRPRLPLLSDIPAQGSSIVSSNLESSEMANLLNFVEEIGTAPTTPITSASHVNILTPPNADETAMEATPENTPLQTPVKDRERLTFKLPERTSTAAMHLNFGGGKSVYSFPPTVPPNSTPSNSVPSSPLPQTEPIRRESNAGELNLGRRDSILLQRLQKVLVEQQQQQHTESRGLMINIPPQGDSDGPQEPPGGPLTPLLQPTAELDDPPPPCNHEGPCRGGLHMPDTKSLIAFVTSVKRLRFYSHCEDTGVAVVKSKAKRSLSCSDIKEEEPADDSEDGKPTPEPPRPPYEHLFEGIVDVWGEKELDSSPHVLLDECVKKAASLHGSNNLSEARLKAHIELLHNQLLFERHRREAHTVRNRRLANKARRAQICEEQNLTYRNQIHQLEKEIASLKKETMRQRNSNHVKESELCNTIRDLETKLKSSKHTIESLEAQNTDTHEQYRQLKEEFNAITKEGDEKSAVIFSMESEIKHCKNYLTANTELQNAYQAAQKDIIMLGELCRRQEEVLGAIEPTRFIESADDMKMTYEEELRSLRNALESKSSQCEASQGYIQDLEQTLAMKNKVIEDLKKLVQDTGAEYYEKLTAMEDKYAGVRNINHRLELEILNLQHQVSVKSKAGSGAMGDSSIRNGVSPTDSDITVDSAASAGGFGGLSSPEPNDFIFGSPQFDNSAPRQSLMNDLRQNID